jgi:rRNA maturation protein Nop10
MFTLRCQRCGTDMVMRDPAPGGPWKADQFWVCPRCGRHFWTTYAAPPTNPEVQKAPEPAEKG